MPSRSKLGNGRCLRCGRDSNGPVGSAFQGLQRVWCRACTSLLLSGALTPRLQDEVCTNGTETDTIPLQRVVGDE